MVPIASGGRLERARRALDARQESPEQAARIAQDVLDESSARDEARLVALWALGLAERELSHLPEAHARLEEAVAVGVELADDELVALVRSALVAVLAALGRPEQALDLADLVDPRLDGEHRAELDMKRALALEQLGRLDEALDAYTRALDVVVDSPNRLLEARLRCNRGIVLAYQGRTEKAVVDSNIAERLALDEGHALLAGGAAHNAGFAHGRRGDVVAALESFDRADRLYESIGYPGRCDGVLAADRCEVLLVAGLHDEARTSAERAVAALEQVADVADLAEARLLLARACLASGDAEAAMSEAATAASAFRDAGRGGWAVLAEYVSIGAEARLAASAGDDADDRPHRVAEIADELDVYGWQTEATAARVAAATAALEHHNVEFARAQLRQAAPSRAGGSADRRAHAWLATAMLRDSSGDRAGARRALTAGIKVVTSHQATLGATELRVGAASHATGLAQFGIGLALDDRRAGEVLQWAERVRANALAAPAARPPPERRLAAELAELRRLGSELDASRSGGDPAPALARQVHLQEELVRDVARRVRGDDRANEVMTAATIRGRLGDETLVEYIEHAGRHWAVVVTRSRCRLVRLAAAADVAGRLDDAMFAMRRLARSAGSEASKLAAAESLVEAGAALSDLLVEPLRLATTSVVVVPTGRLHTVPWGALSGLTHTELVVSPSSSRWRRGEPPGSAAVTVVAGPGLDHAADEAAAVRRRYTTGTTLAGPAATVPRALESLDAAAVAHIVCHGHLRADSPMFSSLELHDGPLTVYDLEQLVSPPRLVVLPACDAGAARVTMGDELIGTASALLQIGVGAVIAPVAPINDEATVELMDRLHARLTAGDMPAAALAEVRQAALASDPSTLAAGLAFHCLS